MSKPAIKATPDGLVRFNQIKPFTNVCFSALFIILALMTFLPVFFVFMISISSEASIAQNGYSFWPAEFSLESYAYLWQSKAYIGRAFLNSIGITVCGTLLVSETFWEKDTDPDPTPETDTTGATVTPESGTDAPRNNNETGGCGQAFGNTLVIAMILVAAFLFWFIDSKRRHS